MNDNISNIYRKMISFRHKDVTLNNMVGGGDPQRVGESTLDLLLSFKCIRTDSVVFDLGCGCGRTAIEQARMLKHGEYHGFDIIPTLVNFCSEHIVPTLPNTSFYLSREKNPLYQDFIEPSTRYAEFDDISAVPDLITAFSLFTHFDYTTSYEYLKRMRDKIRPEGAICLSMFLLNDQSKARIELGRSNLHFDISEKGLVFGDPSSPLARVGWNERFLKSVLADLDLEIHSIIYGNWSGTFSPYYQDYLLIKPRFKFPLDFDPERYLELNPDLPANNANPFHHYVNYGRFEVSRRYS